MSGANDQMREPLPEMMSSFRAPEYRSEISTSLGPLELVSRTQLPSRRDIQGLVVVDPRCIVLQLGHSIPDHVQKSSVGSTFTNQQYFGDILLEPTTQREFKNAKSYSIPIYLCAARIVRGVLKASLGINEESVGRLIRYVRSSDWH